MLPQATRAAFQAGAVGAEQALTPMVQMARRVYRSGAGVRIVAIAGKLVHANRANVSPMLPSELAAQCELEEIEHCLSDVLRGGHLHSISDRPRRDLRYDEFVAPVARARRLATSALSHLASHSDCWQQRTLSGVLPRKVLARFSDVCDKQFSSLATRDRIATFIQNAMTV